MNRLMWSLILIALNSGFTRAEPDTVITTEKHAFKLTIVAKGLEHPWSLAFLPDGEMLVTERPGRLRLVKPDGFISKPISGLPSIKAKGQGGLLDVILHPDFKTNRRLYLAHSGPGPMLGTEVISAELHQQTLKNVKTVFRMQPKSKGGRHFGGRLLFDDNGFLYITLGDRGDRDRAQRLQDHAGSIIRLKDDGSIPETNPFHENKTTYPEIYTYGNRNVQGIALQKNSGLVWAHEHGPQGGDELNIIKTGVNYGWPVITYGVNYVIGTKIGKGTRKPGMEQPIYYWVPSIAPSGMTFYTANKFPNWQGNLFIGSLKFRTLLRLELKDNKVLREERMLTGVLGRIRDVRQGPDGFIYLLTDSPNGLIARLEPSMP